ncbi:MAG: sialidase family protein, partial [Pyrinomonadaceae bacterium]
MTSIRIRLFHNREGRKRSNRLEHSTTLSTRKGGTFTATGFEKSSTRTSFRPPLFLSLSLAALIAASILTVSPRLVSAADPGSGTLAPTATAPLTWNGTATGPVAPTSPATTPADVCQEGVNCDTFTLTLAGSPADWAGKVARVRIEWTLLATDYDLYIHKDTVNGQEVASSADGPTTFESADIDPAATGTGNYAVRVVYFAATAADQYRAGAKVEVKPPPPPNPPPSTEPAPRYFNYAAPNGLGTNAGEPTLGANWKTGNVMFIAGLETLRVTFDDSSSPARANWADVSAPNTSIQSFDPILFTDGDAGQTRTNRTFVSQLLPTKISLMAFSDDDGATWAPSQGAGINSGVDHQTVGGGPYAPNGLGAGPRTSYPHAVYYASQDVGLAEIARSDDGGLTFGVAVPMWDLTQCGGLHGHIKVAPDGTVYVPNKGCGEEQAVAVSEDNGLTWEIRKVPGSRAGRTDPSVGIGSDGTIYFGYANGDGHQRVAVSRDRGRTWEHDRDIGAAFGIQNTVFPAVVAGDGDRAAVFFLGTSTPGSAGVGTDKSFTGTWYGFVATTYDGGRIWVTVNATPNDPVQRGVVCTNGTTCPSGTRNLLDFNDATVDQQGRVLAAFADGCVTADCIGGRDRNGDNRIDSNDNDGADLATIIRQSGGKGLFAA